MKRLVEAGRKLAEQESAAIAAGGSGRIVTKSRRRRPAEKKSSKAPEAMQGLESWTKKQRNDFVRALMCFGKKRDAAGNASWDSIRERAALHDKSDEDMATMFKAVVNEMKEVVAMGEQEAASHIGLLSWTSATKLRKRLMLLQQLREKVLNNPMFEDLVATKAPAKIVSFPPSWGHQHDAALLRGVEKHGIGEWTTIFGDTSLEWGDPLGVATPKSDSLFKRTRGLIAALAAFASAKRKNEFPPTEDLETFAISSVAQVGGIKRSRDDESQSTEVHDVEPQLKRSKEVSAPEPSE
jgi:hypothetical protein